MIRTEADFERVVCLAISGKNHGFEQHFVFVGDFSPFFEDGIKNQFQKHLFKSHGFSPTDLCEASLFGKLLKRTSGGKFYSFNEAKNSLGRMLRFLGGRVLQRYLIKRKKYLVNRILSEIKPDLLMTDQSGTGVDYIPELFRKNAILKNIPVYIFTHGAAGGLHSFFSKQNFELYKGCTVLACSKYEDKSDLDNRIILGDMSSSFPYVHYLNTLDIGKVNFHNDCKYKVGFFVGGTGPFTTTTGWHTMEEIIIDLSENKDVAMILKLHPREAPFIDLRLLRKFDNLLIVNRETDRSRVTKWADIIVASDHCSTIFEPMILGKKVVAIEGRHIPRYKDVHSPLKNSSVMHITSANQFDLDSIPNANPEDNVTNMVAWGGHGKVNLAKLALHHIQESL